MKRGDEQLLNALAVELTGQPLFSRRSRMRRWLRRLRRALAGADGGLVQS